MTSFVHDPLTTNTDEKTLLQDFLLNSEFTENIEKKGFLNTVCIVKYISGLNLQPHSIACHPSGK